MANQCCKTNLLLSPNEFQAASASETSTFALHLHLAFNWNPLENISFKIEREFVWEDKIFLSRLHKLAVIIPDFF